MRKPSGKMLALAAAAGVAATLLVPTAAQAAYWGSETNYVAISSGPTGDYSCVSHTGVTACFKPLGDLLYVRDIRADGYAAVVEWTADAPVDSYRDGSCVNNLGSGNWGVCDKDFVEGVTIVINGARYTGGNLVDRGHDLYLTT
ncbi:hypothetical protein [Dactylosporangium darangshiense]|uniref:Secreted protein n=1 Tax=Dactylosporangium darangshiense TaxID=579108 RepID=A0ABP8DU89_9ACTN